MKNECRKEIRVIAVFLAVTILMVSLLVGCSVDRTQSSYELDVVNHTSDFYVNDFAGVFSEEQKKQLMENAVSFDGESSGIQVVITTVESLNSAVQGYEYVVKDVDGNRIEGSKQPSSTPKFTIEQVSYSMYTEYGIGKDDMGILILFSTGDREVRIETGRQMQFYITDSVSGRLLDDYGMDYFREDKFAEGLISLQEGVIAKIKAEVPSDWNESSEKDQKVEDSEDSGIVNSGSLTDGNSNEDVTTNKTKEKNPATGIFWGLFGSIAATFAAVIAFIRKKFKSKREAEIEALKANHQIELNEKNKAHDAIVSELKEDYQRLIQEKDSTVQKMRGEIDRVNYNVRTLTIQLNEMTNKYTRAQQLHPEFDFDKEVYEMIEDERKAAARDIDCKLAEVLNTPASKDNESFFKDALILIDSTVQEVKKYVTSCRDDIQRKYDKAVALRKEFERIEQEKKDKAKAHDAYQKIKCVFDRFPKGNHKTYKDLQVAFAIFSGLSVAQKAFFPDEALIKNLKREYESAETDYRDYQKAKDAESNAESIVRSIYSADEDDRDRLAKAMRYYKNLTSAQQSYFSEDLLRKLKRLISDADEDHRRQENRRRQQRSASVSHSSSHRSSYGGRGGRPSGGGASRKF